MVLPVTEYQMQKCIAAFFGAGIGFVLYVFVANLENFAFFTIRRLVTGKNVMSEIVHHPADRWIIPALLCLFVLSGAGFGVLIEWSCQPKKKQ